MAERSVEENRNTGCITKLWVHDIVRGGDSVPRGNFDYNFSDVITFLSVILIESNGDK